MEFTWSDVCARRLVQHGLSASRTVRPVDVVSAMAGTHAQVMSAAEMSIALRIPDATRADVRNAPGLVKTFGPRGTVHLLPEEELPLWLGALSAVPIGPSVFPDGVRMTAEQTEEVLVAIGKALAGNDLTVDELTEALVSLVGSWAGDLVMPAFQGLWPRWRQITHLAAHRGVLCFGAGRGRKVTYTNPGARPAATDVSLEHVVKSYLRAYGPSTPQRFAHWLTAPVAWATKVFGSVELQEVAVAGKPAWIVPGDVAVPEVARGVWLLPYFDGYSYRVGNQPAELLYPGKASERVLPANFQNLVIDGTVAGLWHQRKSGRKVEITVEPVVKLAKSQRAQLDRQVERVGEIVDARPELTIGVVTVGGHA